jgi:hypothetical protein
LKTTNAGTTDERNYSEIQVLGNNFLECNYGLNLHTSQKKKFLKTDPTEYCTVETSAHTVYSNAKRKLEKTFYLI